MSLLVLSPDALTRAPWTVGGADDVRELPEATGWGWDSDLIQRAISILTGFGYDEAELRLHAVPGKPMPIVVCIEEPEDEEYAVSIAPVLDQNGPYAAGIPENLRVKVGPSIFRAWDALHTLGLMDARHIPDLLGYADPTDAPEDLDAPLEEEA